jgi:hypothetical protein
MARTNRISFPHPGETRKEDFLEPLTSSTTAKFWLNLQAAYDLAIAAGRSAQEIERAVHPLGLLRPPRIDPPRNCPGRRERSLGTRECESAGMSQPLPYPRDFSTP